MSTPIPIIRQVGLSEAGDHGGLVVVVDVLRAFTVAPLALQAGARAILSVATVEEALAARAASPENRIIMGEVDAGRAVDRFDLNNSPTELSGLDVTGKVVVHRTSHGTQGLVRAAPHAEVLLAASFACASATTQAIRTLAPAEVTFVLTGADQHGGDDDRTFADYIQACLTASDVDARPYLDRVRDSGTGRLFGSAERPDLPLSDLEHAMALDTVDRALVADVDGDRILLRLADPCDAAALRGQAGLRR